jgi:hypothetical protein
MSQILEHWSNRLDSAKQGAQNAKAKRQTADSQDNNSKEPKKRKEQPEKESTNKNSPTTQISSPLNDITFTVSLQLCYFCANNAEMLPVSSCGRSGTSNRTYTNILRKREGSQTGHGEQIWAFHSRAPTNSSYMGTSSLRCVHLTHCQGE